MWVGGCGEVGVVVWDVGVGVLRWVWGGGGGCGEVGMGRWVLGGGCGEVGVKWWIWGGGCGRWV